MISPLQSSQPLACREGASRLEQPMQYLRKNPLTLRLSRRPTTLAIAVAVSMATVGMTVGTAVAGEHASHELLGYNDLIERLGENLPTGVGVIVAQVEAPDSGGDYGPKPERLATRGQDLHRDERGHGGSPTMRTWSRGGSMGPCPASRRTCPKSSCGRRSIGWARVSSMLRSHRACPPIRFRQGSSV